MVMGRLRSFVAGSFWVLPAGLVLMLGLMAGALTLGDAVLWRSGLQFAFAAGPDTARSLLSVIASSTLTLAGLSFSVTLVVLVLASSQYSPRVLRTFLRDRRTKLTLGVFLGTYVYALVALRAVRDVSGTSGRAEPFVPGVTISAGFVLALVAIGVFALFIDHVVKSVQVEHIIGRIAADTRAAVERVHPPDGGAAAEPAAAGNVTGTVSGDPTSSGDHAVHDVMAPHPGVVTWIDVDALVAAAHDADVVLALRHGVGQFVPGGAPLLAVLGGDLPDDDAAARQVTLAASRLLTRDVAFGLRQLVDIAERALSPGTNDPTTAAQALDQLHDLLRRLATRPLRDGRHTDADGVIRLYEPTRSWDDYVGLALDEVRHWGAGSLQIHQRVAALIEDLLTVVDDDRAQPLLEQQRLLETRARTDLPPDERNRLPAA